MQNPKETIENALPLHWKLETVSELQKKGALLVEDGNHGEDRPRMNDFENQGVSFIRAGDIEDYQVNFTNASKISNEAYQRIRKGKGKSGDTIITHKGTVGKVGYVPINNNTPFVCSPQTTFYRSLNDKVLLAEYIYFYLLSPTFQNQFNSVSSESDMAPYVSLTNQRSLFLVLPPINEQVQIVEVLSSICDKIILLKNQNVTLEQLAETLFKQWFIIELDEGWEKTTLSNYIKVIDNRGKTPFFTFEATDYPIIEVNALTGNNRFVDYNAIRKFVTKEVYETWFRAGHPAKYDTLISTVGSIGEMAMLLVEKGVIAQNIVAFRAIDTSPFYIYQYLKHFQNEIKEYDIGSVQPSIKVTQLIKMEFVQPDVETLDKFDIQMKSITDKIILNTEQIQSLTELRDTLLPKLMSGEVRVETVQEEMATA